jgi:hypothetical protein
MAKPQGRALGKQRSSSGNAGKQRTTRKPLWRQKATCAVQELPLPKSYYASYYYAGSRMMDAVSTIARLDREMAEAGVKYQARYLGLRDGRPCFKITVIDKDAKAAWEALDRAGGIS